MPDALGEMGPSSTTAGQTRLCAHHPDRAAHALCMSCRRPICQECATEWEGINYCAACLPRQRQERRHSYFLAGWLALLAATVLLFHASTRLMVWAGVVMRQIWS
jgi:hypothetical protein